jgi:transcription antitermination factor NusG
MGEIQGMHTSVQVTLPEQRQSGLLALPARVDADWLAAYVTARHEKKIALQLNRRGVPYLLPLYRSIRRWKDRRKELDLPLFPGYIFVNIAMKDRLRVQSVPGVVHFVQFNGQPAFIPQNEIDNLRRGLSTGATVEPHPFLTVGRKVRVRSGAMAGLEGVLTRRKDKFRVVITIELIQRSLAVEVDEGDIEPS